MLFRILEFCLSIVAVALVAKEIVIPLLKEQPLFPMLRNKNCKKKNAP